MDFTPNILLNDDIRKALVEGCPYVLSGGFRAEIESSEKSLEYADAESGRK